MARKELTFCVQLKCQIFTGGSNNESKAFSKTDVREVQDHQAQGSRYGHLRESSSQAKAGLIWLELSGAATRTLTAAAMRREGSERKSSMNAESPKCSRSAEPTRRSPKGKANAGVR